MLTGLTETLGRTVRRKDPPRPDLREPSILGGRRWLVDSHKCLALGDNQMSVEADQR